MPIQRHAKPTEVLKAERTRLIQRQHNLIRERRELTEEFRQRVSEMAELLDDLRGREPIVLSPPEEL